MAERPGFYQGKHYTEHLESAKSLKLSGRLDEAERLLLCLVEAMEAEEGTDRSGVGPGYYNQLAVIYRKQKKYAAEVQILQRFARQRHGRGAMVPKLLARLEKARELLDRDNKARKEIAEAKTGIGERKVKASAGGPRTGIITLTCEKCGKILKVPAWRRGQTGRSPVCGTAVPVPNESGELQRGDRTSTQTVPPSSSVQKLRWDGASQGAARMKAELPQFGPWLLRLSLACVLVASLAALVMALLGKW